MQTITSRRVRTSYGCGALLLVSLAAATTAGAATLDRIKETGHIRFGYFADARPFTYRGASGGVEGYGAALCERIAEQAKGELGLGSISVDWVPITGTDPFAEVQQGNIDVLCTPTSVTLNRRRQVSYSIPVFPGGARAVVRANAPTALREALADTPSTKPVWRGSPAAHTLRETTVATVSGTTAEIWLTGAISAFQIGAKLAPVPNFATGLQQLRDGKADVFFGDRAAILGAMDPATAKDFVILDRVFTREQYALAVPRGDEDFRLVVDRALSVLFASGEIANVYARAFGPPDAATRTYFQWNTLTQ